MSLLESFLSHAGENECYPIAIIPIVKDVTLLLEPLGEHQVWQWSTEFAKVENVHPVVYTDNAVVQSNCLPLGIDCILIPKRTSQVKAILTVLDSIKNTCFFLMDAYYPVRARGLMRTMLAKYYTQDYPSSIVAPGISLHNSDVFRATHELKFKSTSITFPLPDCATSPLTTTQERAALAETVLNPMFRVFDPWFTPQSIAVVNGSMPLTKQQIEKLKQCDLYAYLMPNNGRTPLATLPFHIYFYSQENMSPPSNTYPAVHYRLCTAKKSNSALWDISAWSHIDFSLAVLSPFAKCLLLLHCFYPEATITYSAFILSFVTSETYEHDMRERAAIFEKIFLNGLSDSQLFVDITAEPKLSLKGVSPLKPDEDENTNTFFAAEEEIDYSQYKVLHIQHSQWVDRILLQRETTHGVRLSTNDYFTYNMLTPNFIRVVWERWGTEDFHRSENTNIWRKSDA